MYAGHPGGLKEGTRAFYLPLPPSLEGDPSEDCQGDVGDLPGPKLPRVESMRSWWTPCRSASNAGPRLPGHLAVQVTNRGVQESCGEQVRQKIVHTPSAASELPMLLRSWARGVCQPCLLQHTFNLHVLAPCITPGQCSSLAAALPHESGRQLLISSLLPFPAYHALAS